MSLVGAGEGMYSEVPCLGGEVGQRGSYSVQSDRHPWKHYLSATSLAGGIKRSRTRCSLLQPGNHLKHYSFRMTFIKIFSLWTYYFFYLQIHPSWNAKNRKLCKMKEKQPGSEIIAIAGELFSPKIKLYWSLTTFCAECWIQIAKNLFAINVVLSSLYSVKESLTRGTKVTATATDASNWLHCSLWSVCPWWHRLHLGEGCMDVNKSVQMRNSWNYKIP